MKKDFEKIALLVSMSGSILLSASAVIMTLITGSQAILLDGLYTFVTLTMAFLSLKVLYFLKKPETKSKPFGYMILEPFLNLIKCLVMLCVLIVFLITNIQELFTGGREISLNLTTLYIFICLIIYSIIILMMIKYGRKAPSSILELEIKNWCIDAFQTAGIGVSLITAIILYNLGYTEILPFIDPVIVIVLVLLSLPVPLKVFIIETSRLLLISPENRVENEVKEHLKPVIARYSITSIQVWSLNSGRTHYLFLYLDLKNDSVTIVQLDEIRDAIFKELSNIYPNFWADIMFTRINPELPNPYTDNN